MSYDPYETQSILNHIQQWKSAGYTRAQSLTKLRTLFPSSSFANLNKYLDHVYKRSNPMLKWQHGSDYESGVDYVRSSNKKWIIFIPFSINLMYNNGGFFDKKEYISYVKRGIKYFVQWDRYDIDSDPHLKPFKDESSANAFFKHLKQTLK